MLLAYPKSGQDTLTASQKSNLKKLVHQELQESNDG